MFLRVFTLIICLLLSACAVTPHAYPGAPQPTGSLVSVALIGIPQYSVDSVTVDNETTISGGQFFMLPGSRNLSIEYTETPPEDENADRSWLSGLSFAVRGRCVANVEAQAGTKLIGSLVSSSSSPSLRIKDGNWGPVIAQGKCVRIGTALYSK